MSQAEELLTTLVTSAGPTSDSTEPHFIVSDDRFITVPSVLKRIAVQYDHNVETVTFDCPRYWDGLDMSTMVIYINYLRADNNTGIYKATNIAVDEEDTSIMHFDWTISRNVTEVSGRIVFLVCIRKSDGNGVEENHWNSELCKDCYVSEGLEGEDGEIQEIYPDLIEKWNNEVLDAINRTDTATQEMIDMRDGGVFDGATFTPSVATNGDISWTNDKGLANPATVNIMGPFGVSPELTVSDIQGGHRITITDINGTKYVDIMDTIINNADAVREAVNDCFYIGEVEPTTGPVLWFDTSKNT